jgi:hypothetical protein
MTILSAAFTDAPLFYTVKEFKGGSLGGGRPIGGCRLATGPFEPEAAAFVEELRLF